MEIFKIIARPPPPTHLACRLEVQSDPAELISDNLFSNTKDIDIEN